MLRILQKRLVTQIFFIFHVSHWMRTGYFIRVMTSNYSALIPFLEPHRVSLLIALSSPIRVGNLSVSQFESWIEFHWPEVKWRHKKKNVVFEKSVFLKFDKLSYQKFFGNVMYIICIHIWILYLTNNSQKSILIYSLKSILFTVFLNIDYWSEIYFWGFKKQLLIILY